jgi:hypothetical protein
VFHFKTLLFTLRPVYWSTNLLNVSPDVTYVCTAQFLPDICDSYGNVCCDTSLFVVFVRLRFFKEILL